MNCRYCFHLADDLRDVRLTHAPGSGQWQKVTQICGACRKYLRGFFKYVQIAKAGKP